ncbi:uncharacterized protein [Trachinotus anak]|uniref:uncharacterized protein isoform X2 n=1 Tax=Trachinotus anak TaxID=443729 RepID=UPI0039F236A9
MSVLLTQIRLSDQQAASVVEGAGFHTDSDLQTLTREDLNELFPGANKLKLRRTIFEIIHKKKPINVVLEDLRGFIPHESLRSALTNNGVLADYLRVLKDIKTQVNNVQTFLDAHIDLLENMSKTQVDPEPGKGSLPGTSDSFSLVEPCSDGHPQGAQVATVKYQQIVCGETFGAHQQLMEQVKGRFQDGVQIIESSQDSQVIVVFCPISSRVGSDAAAAMTSVKDDNDKPVILVLMHHTRQSRFTNSLQLQFRGTYTVLQVNVFYHDSIHGLVKCEQNNQAVSLIRKELLKHKSLASKDTSAGHGAHANMGVERGRSSSASTGYGGNTKSEGFFSRYLYRK